MNGASSRGARERRATGSPEDTPDPADATGPPPAGQLAGSVGGTSEPVGRIAGPGRRGKRRRGVAALAGAGLLLVLVAGGIGVRAAAGPGDRGEPPLASAGPTAVDARAATAPPGSGPTVTTGKPGGSWGPATSQSPVAAPTERAAAGTKPVGVRIPAIGVDATSLVPLAIIPATGELAAPAEFHQTGWYAAGPVPGEPGPAVVAAHVDSRGGPAVFFRLKELKPGDAVYVPRLDGITVTFTVTDVERYPKDAFPTQKVHGPTPDRALRLITCGGSFDSAKRSYRDNIVVYAVRSGQRG